MTITLLPEQEQAIQQAIRGGAIRSVDEFIDAAIAKLPKSAVRPVEPAAGPRKSRLWELREGLDLGEISIKELIEEGRE
jgi:hypothetical protein